MPYDASRPGDRIRSLLASAVAAHRAGQRNEARRLYDQVLAADPDSPWARYFRGVLAVEDGQQAVARTHLQAACRTGNGVPQFHMALGNLELAAHDAAAAASCFRAAIAERPEFAAAHTGLCLALKHLGQLDDAAAAAARALQLRRGWSDGKPVSGFVDPAEVASMHIASRVKLRHDIDQLRYLRAIGRLDAAIEPVIAGLEKLLRQQAAQPHDNALFALSEAELTATNLAYNRAIHVADAPRLAGPALTATAFQPADQACAGSPDAWSVVDEALTPPALESLQRLLVESTIWFEVKDHGGHLGAYFEEGLACGLIAQIAEELRTRLPRTLQGRRLAQVWAYKYQQGFGGTELHADIGAVSVNLWVTPDRACLDPGSGGLEILPVSLPPDWDFQRMNVERDALRRFAAESGAAPVQIPYRCNRMVVFGARLLHRTAPARFAEAYPDRRTNVTFLFA